MESSSKQESLELIKRHLPKYLTLEQQEDLFQVVKESFPKGDDPSIIYFNIPDDSYFYQGDGLIDIPFASFIKGKYLTNYFYGIVMSNTCDIAIENERLESSFIQLACIFNLADYIKELEKRNVSKNKIDSFIVDLKNNRISNLFFLPQKKVGNKILLKESFVRFDINTTIPISDLNKNYNKNYINKNGDRIFSFSNYGFYLFLIKISIHYCRFREGVFRSA